MGKRRRSDKARQQVFSYFISKSQVMSPLSMRVFGKNKHGQSAQRHEAMLAKARGKFLAKIKAWIKAKIKSIFKVD